MALETIANLTGQFDQFNKRVDRMQTESDNAKRELTDAIRELSNKIDAVNNKIDAVKQEFGNTQKWQISCLIAAIIAVCAIAGLVINLLI